MSVFQCRMCGGTLDVKLYSRVCRCSYCGTEQSVPRLGLSEKDALLERAERYRRNGDQDGALMLYEQALSMETDDADIYWAIVLCRYGVEYVYDPVKKLHIPTINRTRLQSVSQDSDFLSAMKYGDEFQQSVFRRQAEELDRIQNDIIAAAKKIEPFDIFICYKESDGTGRRTVDSVIAGELYRKLADEGYRVFFSRVTLEDKAGSAYEPYIYSALNSARVMLLLTTSAENLRSAWVRNEWSRFLALAADGEKTLAVLSKGVAPGALPEELRHLQMTDIEKLGWEQDIIHGLEKLIRRKSSVTVVNSAGAAPLIRRAKMFLEDRNYPRAVETCERALDQEPENAEAYFTRLLAEFAASTPEELCALDADFTMSDSYRKAERFAQGELAEQVKKCGRSARMKHCQYNILHAVTEQEWLSTAAELDKLAAEDNTDGAAELASQCRRRAERARQEEQERREKQLLSGLEYQIRQSTTVQQIEEALKQLAGIRGADDIVKFAGQRIEELSAEQERAKKSAAQKRRRSRGAIIALAAACSVSVAGGAITVFSGISATSAKYNNAIALREVGEFQRAHALFTELGNYRDSYDQLRETEYRQALSMLENGDNNAACTILTRLSVMSYSDAGEYLNKAKYAIAEEYEASGEIKKAAEAFAEIGDYADSSNRSAACWETLAEKYAADEKYIMAAELYSSAGNENMETEMRLTQAAWLMNTLNTNGAEEQLKSMGLYGGKAQKEMYALAEKLEQTDPDMARAVYKWLGNYKGSESKLQSLLYSEAKMRLAEGDNGTAITLLEELGDYSDSEELLQSACYAASQDSISAGDYSSALKYLSAIHGYKDADALYKECRYQQGFVELENEDYRRAQWCFNYDETYKDSANMLLETKYRRAVKLRSEHIYDEADKIFEELGDYSDAAEKLAESLSVRLSGIRAGDNLYIGSFWQSQYSGKEATPIEWECLEVSDGTALLISRKLLAYEEFGGENWADSTLRTWLNGEFYNSAFTQEEKQLIGQTSLVNVDNPTYGTWGGENTLDNVFILSRNEAQKYFSGDLTGDKTGYALMQEQELNGSTSSFNGGNGWWLRSTGKMFCIESVSAQGGYSDVKYNETNFVRPCIRIRCGD